MLEADLDHHPHDLGNKPPGTMGQAGSSLLPETRESWGSLGSRGEWETHGKSPVLQGCTSPALPEEPRARLSLHSVPSHEEQPTRRGPTALPRHCRLGAPRLPQSLEREPEASESVYHRPWTHSERSPRLKEPTAAGQGRHNPHKLQQPA